MKNLRVELIAGGQTQAEVKIKRVVFQKDSISLPKFILEIVPLNHVLRKYTVGYKLSKSREKINHFMYMDDIKLFAEKWKRIGNPDINNKNI